MSPEQATFLEQLYRENFQRLRGYAYHQINDWDKAEVAVQEAFCVAVGKIGDVMSSDAPLRWMKAAVKHTVQNMRRHESYQKALFLYLDELSASPSAPDVLGGVGMEELCEQIAGKEDFRLFKHIVLDGVSYLEAAKELDLGLWACRKRVQRTTQTLRGELQKIFQ